MTPTPCPLRPMEPLDDPGPPVAAFTQARSVSECGKRWNRLPGSEMVVLVQRAAPPPTPHSPSYPTGTSRGQPCRYVGAAADVIVARPRLPKLGGSDGRREPEPDAARLTLRGAESWIALRGCWDGGDVIHRHRHAPAHARVVLCKAYAPAGLTSSVWRVPGCPWTLVLAAAAAERLARKDVQRRTAY